MTTQHALALAMEHHRAGRLAEAEALYRQILAVQPNHADALHLLGAVAHQSQRADLAVKWIEHALILNPNNPAAHSNLGEAYRSLGQIEEALRAYRRAIQLKPDFSEAYENLGLALVESGRHDEAIATYREVIRLKPRDAEGYCNLGNALVERSRWEEAIVAYRQALALDPNQAGVHNNLANSLREQGDLEAAIAAYRCAVRLQPESAEIHNNLGNALREQGRFDEAVAACRRAVQIRPDFVEAHNNLGLALAEHGQFAEAVTTCRRAIELRPDYAEAHNNLGLALAEQGRVEEATVAYRRALSLRPDYAIAHSNLGNALRERGLCEEAVTACREAIRLDPESAEAWTNLGLALAEDGQIEEAIAAYRRALELKPGSALAHNNLGNAFKDRGEMDEAIAALSRAVELEPGRAWVHSNLIYALHFRADRGSEASAKEAARWKRQFADPLKVFLRPHPNDHSPDRPLRVGYVSADFRDHVVGRNLLPLFRNHDRHQFEVFCYSGVVNPDALTKEMSRLAGPWRDTLGWDDEALADLIRRDGVDILVDLTQHMASNRLPMLARQPAPVQVSFAGYPAGTGLEAIGHRISDRFLEAATVSSSGAQEQVYLIDSFWCYDAGGVEVEVNAPPAQHSGQVTFGSLNNFCKINEPMLKIWGRVLAGVKDSRLLLLSPEGSHRQRTLAVLEQEGIAASRVEFVARLPRRTYLELHLRLDIVLDSFPYNGHTTSLDALGMGVPVVTLVGEHPVSRAGFSQLSNLGLAELAAFSEDDYVGIATQLAHDLPRLAQLRSTLRPRMRASPLMDAARFARSIEDAYRAMWRQWCADAKSRDR